MRGHQHRNVTRQHHLIFFCLPLQDRKTRFEIRWLNIGNEPRRKTRPQALVQRRDVLRRPITGEHDLPVCIDQRVKGMEEFFLGALFTGKVLHIINQKHIDLAIMAAKVGGPVVLQMIDQLADKALSREVRHAAHRSPFLDMSANRAKQVGFSESTTAIDEQRVVRPGGEICDSERSRVSKLIRCANNEISKGIIHRACEISFILYRAA